MPKQIDKRVKEKELVSLMIEIYCRGRHGARDGLCSACKELESYAMLRSEKCPHMETKSFCSSCKTHCYKPDMRDKIREVMRYSGPRLLFHHPLIAFRHMLDTMREKRRKGKS